MNEQLKDIADKVIMLENNMKNPFLKKQIRNELDSELKGISDTLDILNMKKQVIEIIEKYEEEKLKEEVK